MSCTLPRQVQHGIPRVRCSTSRAALQSGRVEAPTAQASRVFDVPNSANKAVKQSIDAIESAYKAGTARQRIDVLLPLVGATDLDDWYVLPRSWETGTSSCKCDLEASITNHTCSSTKVCFSRE
jgi:hypothetical protein